MEESNVVVVVALTSMYWEYLNLFDIKLAFFDNFHLLNPLKLKKASRKGNYLDC